MGALGSASQNEPCILSRERSTTITHKHHGSCCAPSRDERRSGAREIRVHGVSRKGSHRDDALLVSFPGDAHCWSTPEVIVDNVVNCQRKSFRDSGTGGIEKLKERSIPQRRRVIPHCRVEESLNLTDR